MNAAPAQPASDGDGRAPLAWSLAGLVLLLTSTQLPFVTAAKFG